LEWFGFPIQLLRAAMATIAAIFIIRSLRVFEEANRRRIERLQKAQMQERQRLEATRAELLHRTVKAQESERQRIARELHDETGQTLTALGLGLRGLGTTIQTSPQRALEQARQLEALARDGLVELQRLVAGLHPPQLDDLGLLAALRWYAREIQTRYQLDINVTNLGEPVCLPIEVRTVLFRIVQEAITNIVRHSGADRAEIHLECLPDLTRVTIRDDGKGFDVQSALSAKNETPCWGLIGMRERAALIGGDCQIYSQPGHGTTIQVCVPKTKVTDAENV
jgi:signal transduction histidine kinase